MNIITRSGFEWEIDDDANDDQELLDALVELDENGSKYGKVLDILLGKEGKKALYEHVRNEKGKVRASLVVKELADIVTAMKNGPRKN